MPTRRTPVRALHLARLAWCLGLAFACALPASAVQAQRKREAGDPYVALKVMLGLGGEAELDAVETDMEPTFGGGVAYMHPLHRHFALGGQLALHSWQTEVGDNADLDRNLYADLALVPQLKAPLDEVELYVSVPVGLSLDFPGEDRLTAGGASVSEIDTALGFTAGVLLGARFLLGDGGLGVLAELGYVLHSYEHEVTVLGVSTDVDVDFAQIALNLGLTF